MVTSLRASVKVLSFWGFLLNTFFRCFANVNVTSKITLRCVWELTWETLLLLTSKGGCVSFFNLQLNIIFWACILQSGSKVILYWKAQSLVFFRSLFNSIADVFTSCTTENIMPDFIESFRYIQENTSNFKFIIKWWINLVSNW